MTAIKEPELHGRPQNTPDLFIDDGQGDFAILNGRHQCLRVHEFRVAHFKVEPGICRRHTVIGRAPVGHQYPLKPPFIPEYLVIQEYILCGVFPVDQVVGIHYSAYMPLLHCCLKRRQIDFTQRALINDRVNAVPIEF